MKNELKPCPCCGGKAKRFSASYNTLGAYGGESTENRWYNVRCTVCKLSQPLRYYFTREESDEAWNKRV